MKVLEAVGVRKKFHRKEVLHGVNIGSLSNSVGRHY